MVEKSQKGAPKRLNAGRYSMAGSAFSMEQLCVFIIKRKLTFYVKKVVKKNIILKRLFNTKICEISVNFLRKISYQIYSKPQV